MSPPPAPARVFGFVAAEADVCVLLRRGPSHWTLMVRWDLRTDEFEIGQWLKGRVYENLCHLSPDGRLFVYKALRHGRPPHVRDLSAKPLDAYTAVSRPPYFTALALWEDCGTWGGGGFWESSAQLCLQPGYGKPDGGGVPTGLKVRTSRDWDRDFAKVRERWCRSRVRTDGGTRYWAGPPYLRTGDDTTEVQWADVDHQGRLLFAREGRVFVREADGEREVIDLNPFEFRPLAPPEWATRWPDEGTRSV